MAVVRNIQVKLNVPEDTHVASVSLAEFRDLYEWLGVSRTRAMIRHWYQSYAEYYEQDFMVAPNRVAVHEKQIQFANEENVALRCD